MVALMTAAYQSHLKATRAAVGNAVVREWQRLGSYNEADVAPFLARVTPIVSAGQARAVALSSAYISRLSGSTPVGLDVPKLQAGLRNGVTSAVVFRRPFVRVWTSLQNDGDYEAAIQLGQNQAESDSLMDVALATMASYVAFAAMSSSGDDSGSEIVAWVRRADASCCDYCQMIDGAHTGPNEPQPLHNRCGCTADPIYRSSGFEPSSFLSPGSTHDDVTIHEHGELGPVITRAGDNFTGPSEIPRGDE